MTGADRPPRSVAASSGIGLRVLARGPLLPVVVAFVAAVSFLPALHGEFLHWDDDVNFIDNPHFRGLAWPQLRWMFTTTRQAVYAPLAWVTLGLNYVVGGLDPWGYHLGNVLLHAANTGLVYLVARRLLAAGFRESPSGAVSPGALAGGAVVAALAFGVHPLRVESVAWISERRDVLSGFFYLLAILAYLRGVATGGILRGAGCLASLGAFVAALLAKGLAMTLPLSLLLLDLYPLRRAGLGWRALVREKIPFAVMALGAAVAALLAVHQGSQWASYTTYGPGARLTMSVYSLWFYPSRFVWPAGLSPLYPLPPRVDPHEARFVVALVAVPALTLALLLGRRRFPGGLAAWVHSAIVVAPVSGLVHAGSQLVADRFSYLSGLGFATLAGAGVAWILRAGATGGISRRLARATTVVAVLAIAAWAAGTWRQSQLWHDSERLWRATVAASPECAVCHSNLGATLMVATPGADGRRLDEAEGHFYLAIGLFPDYPDPYRNLGTLLANRGRLSEAEAVLRTFVSRFPMQDDGPSRLAGVLAAQGRAGDAVAVLREALGRRAGGREEVARALLGHGLARAQAGDLAGAAQLLREAATLDPADPRAIEALRSLAGDGRPEARPRP